MTKKLTVMIVDDHPVVRLGISAIIESQSDMTVVAETGDGVEAVALFREHRPSLTVMDLRLESMGGVECIRAIREEFPEARFVVLTTYRGDEDIYQALEAGASGYLIKGMPRQELLTALRQVQNGEKYLPAAVDAALASHTPERELSLREKEVLALLAAGRCNKEIASALCISEITVKCHLSVIYRRLSVTDRTQAVVVAAQRGLIHLL